MLPSLLYHYFGWHYSRAIVDLAGIVLNFRWFFHEVCGVERHIRTFFVPFQRLQENVTNPFDVENVLSAIIVTTLMRIVGMALRACSILVSILLQLATFFVGGILLLAWLIAPFLLLGIIITGITLLFHW